MFKKILDVLNGKKLDKTEVIQNCQCFKDSIGNFMLNIVNLKEDSEYVKTI